MGETWARFFPDVAEAERENHQYPQPLTDEFWEQYAEPLDSFLRAVAVLRDALQYLENIGPAEDESFENSVLVGAGLQRIRSLLGPVALTLQTRADGSYEENWWPHLYFRRLLRWQSPTLRENADCSDARDAAGCFSRTHIRQSTARIDAGEILKSKDIG